MPLAEELAALERQRALAEIRFADSVRLEDMVDRVEARQWSLPPLVLQELFENAVKHNAFDRQSPLEVRVECEGSDLVVSNRLRPRAAPSLRRGSACATSTNACVWPSGRPLRWGTPGDRFVVPCHWHKLRQSRATERRSSRPPDRVLRKRSRHGLEGPRWFTQLRAHADLHAPCGCRYGDQWRSCHERHRHTRTAYKMCIDGQWVDAASSDYFESDDPFPRRPVGAHSARHRCDVDRAVRGRAQGVHLR